VGNDLVDYANPFNFARFQEAGDKLLETDLLLQEGEGGEGEGEEGREGLKH